MVIRRSVHGYYGPLIVCKNALRVIMTRVAPCNRHVLIFLGKHMIFHQSVCPQKVDETFKLELNASDDAG
jgi:hypothetical protein